MSMADVDCLSLPERRARVESAFLQEAERGDDARRERKRTDAREIATCPANEAQLVDERYWWCTTCIAFHAPSNSVRVSTEMLSLLLLLLLSTDKVFGRIRCRFRCSSAHDFNSKCEQAVKKNALFMTILWEDSWVTSNCIEWMMSTAKGNRGHESQLVLFDCIFKLNITVYLFFLFPPLTPLNHSHSKFLLIFVYCILLPPSLSPCLSPSLFLSLWLISELYVYVCVYVMMPVLI